MAVQKSKVSRSERNKRRTHDSLPGPTLSTDKTTGEHASSRHLPTTGMINRLIPALAYRLRCFDFAKKRPCIEHRGIFVKILPRFISTLFVLMLIACGAGDPAENQQRDS